MSAVIQQKLKSINIINVITVLTIINKHNYLNKIEDERFESIRDSILSYIIYSGNILLHYTTIPNELENNIDILIEYMNEKVNGYYEIYV